jgi:hypothetical protein
MSTKRDTGERNEKEKEREAYLEHDGGNRSTERDAVWNCGFPRERERDVIWGEKESCRENER